jgi:chromosome segregation ATPase
MNIMNDQPNVDYVTYFTQQLPKDLAAMAQLRDELAKRQGALSAVEKANKDREKAAKVLENATAEAAAIVEDAQKVAQANDAKKAELSALEEALLVQQNAFASEMATKTADLTSREKQVAKRETTVSALQTEYSSKLQSLDADRAALDARIKAFQDKVAALAI